MAIIRADYGLTGISTGRYQFALQQNATMKVVEATQTSTHIVRSRSLLYDLVFEVFGLGFGVSHFRLSLCFCTRKRISELSLRHCVPKGGVSDPVARNHSDIKNREE